MSTLATPSEVARYLGVSVGSLAQMRHLGRGPAFTKIGSRVRYRWASVESYVDQQTRQQTS
ncbi:helix-turn-helix transcriptional regulator [Rhodococcus sp. NPDC060086]|uniref:helix-turn-helix transcriptional regulator n=1 Tax=Rhodococcus sp. NPDC060086 TaxID=3347055 RepID=UPI003663BDBA